MSRITNQQVQESMDCLAAMTGHALEWGQRFGYNAIDVARPGSGAVSTLVAGLTKRQLYDWLQAAIVGVGLYVDNPDEL